MANKGRVAWRTRPSRSSGARLNGAHRNGSADVLRKARLLVGVAEALLQRPVRSALEIGCGEGTWRSALRRARPGIRYTGVDSSAYVISRFGRKRGIRFGTLGTLSRADVTGPFDLIICTEPLSGAASVDVARGVRAAAALLGGVAYLEAPSAPPRGRSRDNGSRARPAAFYLRAFRRAGLRHLGLHCWVGESLRETTSALRRA